MAARDDRRLVYSTDQVYTPVEPRRPPKTGPTACLPDDGIVRVAREKRRASVVTLVHGIPATEIDALAQTLRRQCGTGGTQKNGVIELQGDHRDAVVALLGTAGKRVKRAGG